MQIQAVNPYMSKNNTNFKSAIPVVYWEKLSNGKYRLVDTLEQTERLHNFLVRRANKTGGKSKQALKERELVKERLIADRDYELSLNDSNFYVIKMVKNKKTGKEEKKLYWEGVSSSYNTDGGFTGEPKRFQPFVYLLTGYDKLIVNRHQQQIHKAWGLAPMAEECVLDGTETIAKTGKVKTQDVDIALDDLRSGKQKLTSRATAQELHVKIAPKGDSYIIEDLKFCNKEGKDSPYVRTKIYPAE